MKRIWIEKIEDWPFSEGSPLSVMGATGSGKTSTVLQWVNKNFPTDLKKPILVSVDAVACYKELNIGSAKVKGEELNSYSWLGIDMLDPSEKMNAALFVKSLNPQIQTLKNEKRPLIFVGGSHFYERALVEGMSPGSSTSPDFLAHLSSLSNEVLLKRLLAQSAKFEKIHLNDRYRLERYLDLTERQKYTYEDLFEQKNSPYEQVYCLALGMKSSPKEFEKKLYGRICEMLHEGWVEEVEGLMNRYSVKAHALESVGYREIVSYLMNKKTNVEDLKNEILVSHRQLAKKQRTWIRGIMNK